MTTLSRPVYSRARAVEERMRALEPLLYERVRPGTKPVDN